MGRYTRGGTTIYDLGEKEGGSGGSGLRVKELSALPPAARIVSLYVVRREIDKSCQGVGGGGFVGSVKGVPVGVDGFVVFVYLEVYEGS